MGGASSSDTPMFGHEPQCYRWDNKCYCNSTQPYKLSHERHDSSLLPPEPPLTVTLTAQQIRSHYSHGLRSYYSSPPPQEHQPTLGMHPSSGAHALSEVSCTAGYEPRTSLGHECTGEADGANNTVPAGTQVPAEEHQYSEPPPPYESLYPSLPPHTPPQDSTKP